MTTFPSFLFACRNPAPHTTRRVSDDIVPCGEMADAIDSKSVVPQGRGVRVPPPAPTSCLSRPGFSLFLRPQIRLRHYKLPCS